MENYGATLAQRIDETYALAENEDGMRRHLGASIIGQKCMRQVWFAFRWCDSEPFDGRMLRLFTRGHKEELVFTRLLRSVGATVWTEDANGSQFRVTALGGHFGGSVDGVAINLPGLPEEVPKGAAVLLEMKTHNDKRFKELLKKGLEAAQPKHFKQAQIYMRGLGLEWCLYCAVNKNDDSLWFHFFKLQPEIGDYLIRRGETIVFGTGLPPRISNHPSWYECMFCAMKGVCFGTKPARQNCRTCLHSRPEQDGTWSCNRGRPEVTTCPKVGCDQHSFIPELLPRC